jgi:hypothetical protein
LGEERGWGAAEFPAIAAFACSGKGFNPAILFAFGNPIMWITLIGTNYMKPYPVMISLVGLVFLTGASRPQTWYLMAPDENKISNPMAHSTMNRGTVVGPVWLSSQGTFDSREDCETARRKLNAQWTARSVMKRGGWERFGLRSPGELTRCMPSTDPQLANAITKAMRETRGSGAAANPSIETFVKTKRFLR